jgi:hypothetical protein
VTVTKPTDRQDRPGRRHIPPPKRRQPAPPAAFGWRWLYPILVLGLGFAVYSLAVAGTRAVLDSGGGRAVEPVTDPALPGYEVLVEPTRVLLLASTDAAGRLVGVTVLVPASGQQGGTVASAPPSVVVAPGDDLEPYRLDEVFAAGGAPALAEAMARFLQVGATDVEVLDPGGWERMVEPAGGLSVRLPDDLVTEEPDGSLRTLFPAGPTILAPDEVPTVFGHLNPGESPANRVARQISIWDAWLAALSDDPDAVPLFGNPLSEVLAVLQGGPVALERLPFEILEIPMADGGTAALMVADVEAARANALRIVPFPISVTGAERVPVRLLNATASLALDSVVADIGGRLVAGGARLVVVGNADPMDRAASQVRTSEAATDEARRLGALLGITDVVVSANHPALADLTVIVGEDLARP